MALRTDDDGLLAAIVGDPAAFAADYWGRRPLHRPAGYDGSHLLDLAIVEALLLTGARHPTFRLVQDGATLPPLRSTRPVRLGGSVVTDVADLERIAEVMAGGATLVLQSLQRTLLPIADLCRSLERALSHPVQANAYLTPAGGAGLIEHSDEHDVLVLQLQGTKAWSVAGLGAVRLGPTDVLYLPAGVRHSASAQQELSLHLTIGIPTITVGAVLCRTLPEVLDRPLPVGYADLHDLAAILAAALADVAAALPTVDHAAVAAAEADRAHRRRGPLLVGHLATVLGLDTIGLDTEVRRRPDQPVTIADDADRAQIVLTLTDRRIRIPAVGRDAICHLLATDRFRVRDLPGIDDSSKIVLVRRLCREQLLVLPAVPAP